MKNVVITDYRMGNLDSVARAVQECGGNPVISQKARDFQEAHYIILPGVGAFATGMKHLSTSGLDEILSEQVINQGIPFLGICLGMQLLATKGLEGGETNGLGWIEGEVKRLEPTEMDTRIPHIGWNEVMFNHPSPLFEGIPSGKDFYFVHSYHLSCQHPQEEIAHTPYCGNFVSAVNKNNIFGVQFHPEKSQRIGFQVLKNFLKL
ncbi:imidazole glycerol phosphate synthase subunit HisH [Phormidium sp. CCY1219]|uniref:imidazole glycerol phosphate synthase subunit HisH n=1 Tax=Phormidium sp. CCY1219 TaxID=2886104 RepID=UPI002D1E7B54|nr:imidazole glycerol phosphate synthase subunit HisH [Phormidium sp. CCY1219]MEB3828473.1 imidazole glycerol phosphate synthase subunit HisH [Phormidium sp. CCY1219]